MTISANSKKVVHCILCDYDMTSVPVLCPHVAFATDAKVREWHHLDELKDMRALFTYPLPDGVELPDGGVFGSFALLLGYLWGAEMRATNEGREAFICPEHFQHIAAIMFEYRLKQEAKFEERLTEEITTWTPTTESQ